MQGQRGGDAQRGGGEGGGGEQGGRHTRDERCGPPSHPPPAALLPFLLTWVEDLDGLQVPVAAHAVRAVVFAHHGSLREGRGARRQGGQSAHWGQPSPSSVSYGWPMPLGSPAPPCQQGSRGTWRTWRQPAMLERGAASIAGAPHPHPPALQPTCSSPMSTNFSLKMSFVPRSKLLVDVCVAGGRLHQRRASVRLLPGPAGTPCACNPVQQVCSALSTSP